MEFIAGFLFGILIILLLILFFIFYLFFSPAGLALQEFIKQHPSRELSYELVSGQSNKDDLKRVDKNEKANNKSTKFINQIKKLSSNIITKITNLVYFPLYLKNDKYSKIFYS